MSVSSAATLREPECILSDRELLELIDLSRPVGLCMTLVLHFVPPDNDPYGVVARFRDALCPGSFLVLSHVTGDEREAGTLTEVDNVYKNANAPLVMRSRAEIARFFNGFELVEPGVVFLSQWRPAGEYYAQGGMHQPAIARLEAGDHEPSLATLSRLARVLGIEFHIDITPNAFGLRETA
jgi:transcriptional regulator with XRE-family HTH domain